MILYSNWYEAQQKLWVSRFMTRLIEKGYRTISKAGRRNGYTALVSEKDYHTVKITMYRSFIRYIKAACPSLKAYGISGMQDIKKKFGKNAILKGMNLEEGATCSVLIRTFIRPLF